jgi:hypothetical protein
MKLKDSQYDFLKWLAIYFIPSLSAFTGVVGCALNWDGTAIATTIISAFGVFLAGCIKMSIAEYEKEKKEKYEGGDTNAE